MPNRFRYLLLATAFQVLLIGHVFAQNDDCTGDEPVRFFFEDLDPVIGDIIFIDITISAVQDVEFLQIPITWDPLLLEFIPENCDVAVPAVKGFTCDNISRSQREQGVIRILWFHPDGANSDIAQDAVIVTLAFRVLGISSDPTSVSISPNVDGFEFQIGVTDPNAAQDIFVTDFCQVGNFFDIGCTAATTFTTPCGGNSPGSGSLNLQVCGGQAPYTALVISSTGQNIPTDPIAEENGELFIENLNPGESYSVRITDSSPTPMTIFDESIDIDLEESIQSDIVIANSNLAALGELLCFAGPRQTTNLTVDVTPAQNGYFFNWENENGEFISGSQIAQDVGAGTYMVTVTDTITGCKSVSQFELRAPDPITYTIDGPFAPACGDPEATGSLTLFIEGGRPEADDIVGAYTVRLDDTDSGNFITGTTKADGAITFSYQNRRTQGLLAGTSWQLIVDDEALGFPGNCPSDTTFFTVPIPEVDAIGYDIVVQDTLTGCDGNADVVFLVTPPPPDPPQDLSDNFVLFDLNGNVVDLDDKKILASGDVIRDIPPGSYTFAYQVPGDPCSGGGSFTVIDAPILEVEPNSLIPIANCGNAIIDIMPTGGTGSYTYTWSDTRQTTTESRRDDLMPGTEYFVTITDSGGCEFIPQDAISIQNIDGLSISQDSIVMQGPGCGQSTGFVQINTSPTDTNQYVLLIDGMQVNGTRVDNLAVGSYELTVQLEGNASCTAGPFSIDIENNAGITLTSADLTITPVECSGTLGSISLPPTTGAQGEYLLKFVEDGRTDTMTIQDRIIDNIEGGTYRLIASYSNSPECTVEIEDLVFIEVDPFVVDVASLDPIQPSCGTGDFGSVMILVDGGQGPYTFEWDDNVIDNNPIRDDLEAGRTYNVTISESSGICDPFITTNGIVIEDAQSLDIKLDSLTVISPDCTGSTGSISLNLVPGDPNEYIIDIGNEQSLPGQALENLAPDSYNVTIRVAGNDQCTSEVFTNIRINDTEDLNITGDDLMVIAPDCSGGLATLEVPSTIVNGQISLDLLIGNTSVASSNNNTLTDVAPGIYTLNIKNEFCDVNIPIDVTAPELTNLSILNTMGPSCGGQNNDGNIELIADGNQDNLMLEWSDGEVGSALMRSGLSQGMYAVTVTNATGCSDTIPEINLNFELTDPFPDPTFSEFASCRGAANGALEFDTQSGEYDFTWDDTGASTDFRNDLIGEREYFITWTIAGNTECSATQGFTIPTLPNSDPFVVDGTIMQTAPICRDSFGTIEIPNSAISNAIGPYKYTLENTSFETIATDTITTDGGGFLSGIPAGNYIGRVEDTFGCIGSFVIIMDNAPIIDIPNAPSLVQPPLCRGDENGTYSITAAGGINNSFDFTWSTGEADQDATESTAMNLPAGEQFVIINDGVCPEDTTFFTVPEGDIVRINDTGTNITDNSCFADSTGIIQLDVIADIMDLTFAWEDFPDINSNRLTDLRPGDYNVIITNTTNGCTTDSTFTVGSPEELQLTIDDIGTVEISCRNPQGTIEVNTNGGTGEYTYTWSHDATINADFAEDLPAQNYMITVSDGLGCIDTTSLELVSEQPIFFEVSEYDPISCAGETTNISVTNIEGGVPPYRFSIIDGGQLFDDTTGVNVGAGSYTFNIFDSDGCQASMKITEDITEPIAPMISLGQDTTIDLGEAYRLIPDVISEVGVDSINYITDATVIPISNDGVAIQADRDVTVTARLVDQDGCIATDELSIQVKKSRKVYIPNIVITNPSTAAVAAGEVDPKNTRFSVYTGIGVSQILSIQVFDRWGSIVYEDVNLPANRQDVGIGNWNGTFEGDRVATGVYGYLVKVEFTDGQILNYKGDVTIIN